ncbi:MAG: hypothetical protein AB7V55_04525 [Oscillospiraceae bacterium]
MSAIWGCISLGDDTLSPELSQKMEAPLHAYTIDRYHSIALPHAVMGCGIQHITPGAKNETLPIWDEDNGLLFTADCFIDNRSELIAELCPGQPDIPDGALLFQAYLHWGEDACKHVRGSYAFAVYNTKENTFMLAADHTLSRSIYYRRVGNTVFFSTLIEPILQGSGLWALNDEWLATFVGLTNLLVSSDTINTVYQGVKRMEPAHCLVFGREVTRSIAYWRPEDVPALNLATDDAYKERFRSIFASAAQEVARSSGEIGISLSSGFDSASVAAFVATELAKQGKNLYGYTWVPIASHKNTQPRHYAANEQADVEKLREMYPNIVPKFFDVAHFDAISEIPRLLAIHETPYKALPNFTWIEAFEQYAAADGCRIMLNGQYGNSTISNGRVTLYPSEMIARGHFIRAFKALDHYAKSMGFSRKRVFSSVLSTFVPLSWRLATVRDYMADSYIDRDFAKKAGLAPRDARLQENTEMAPAGTLKTEKGYVFYPPVFAQTSDAATKLSLKSGNISRDLTRDIRFIEFTLGAPLECFATATQTRRMVRSYLADMLPPDYLPETRPMGVQSGDLMDRLALRWDEIRPEMERVFALPALARYVDIEKVLHDFRPFQADPPQLNQRIFKRLGPVYLLGIFLENQPGSAGL